MFMEASKSSRENFDYFLKWVESSIFIRVIGGCMAVDQLKILASIQTLFPWRYQSHKSVMFHYHLQIISTSWCIHKIFKVLTPTELENGKR